MKIALKLFLFNACFGILSQFLHCTQASAQTSVPTAPWVAPVPENAQWTITVRAASPAPGTVPAQSTANKEIDGLQQISTIKTGTIKHDILTYGNGTKEELWYLDRLSFLTDTFDKTKIYLTAFAADDTEAGGDPVHSLGFPGVSWVTGQAYDKVVTYQDVPCYHYRLGKQSLVDAWIRVKDKLPAAYQINGLVYVYSFGAPPTTPLALPPAYQAVWNQYLDIKKRQATYQRDLGKH